MNPRARRLILHLLPVIPFATAVATVALLASLLWPSRPWIPPHIEFAPQRAAPATPTGMLALDQLALIWQRDLRQPLADAPPPAPAAEPPLAIRLVGTVVEPTQCFGLFQLSNNSVVVKPAGAELEEFQVVSIDRGRATLRNGSRDYELKVPWFERIAATEPAP